MTKTYEESSIKSCQIIDVAQSTLDLLYHKNYILKGRCDGKLTSAQKRAEQRMIEDINSKILELDTEFLRLYQQFFKDRNIETLCDDEKKIIIRLQSLIPLIQQLRDGSND